MVENIFYHEEMEIVVPGPFVVLQGNTGDGLSNTIDGSLPVLPRRPRSSRPMSRANEQVSTVSDGTPDPNGASTTDEMVIDSTSSSSLSSRGEEEFQHVARTPAAGIINGPRFAVTAGVVAAAVAAENSSSSDDFVVVADDENNSSADDHQRDEQATEEELSAIDQWQSQRRRNELQQRSDWEESLYQVNPAIKLNHVMMTRSPSASANNDPESRSWWQRNGEIAVFRYLPTKLIDGSVSVDRICTIPPGSTIYAMELVELFSTTLLPIPGADEPAPPGSQRSFSLGRQGVIQLIQVKTTDGQTGYAPLSLDGYPLLAPGLPDVYVNPGAPNMSNGVGRSHANGSWIWRVTCPSGAYVREGLDLRTRHIRTFPYGSLVRVTRRCINDQGLSRLRTSGYFDVQMNSRNSTGWSSEVERLHVDGWCSELLNPLSGQRGIVAQPLPFPVPAIYRVTLSMG